MPNLIQQKRSIHSDIAVLAYQIWESRGRPAGHDVECWLQAEQQLLLSCSKPQPRSAIKDSRSVQRLREELAFAHAPGF